MGHNNVVNQMKTNFELMLHYDFSLTELENMTPWEYESYVSLLQHHIREKQKKNKNG